MRFFFLTCLDKFDLCSKTPKAFHHNVSCMETDWHFWSSKYISGLENSIENSILFSTENSCAATCVSMHPHPFIRPFMPIYFFRRFSSHNKWLLFGISSVCCICFIEPAIAQLDCWLKPCTNVIQLQVRNGFHNDKWAKWQLHSESWPKHSTALLSLFTLLPYLRNYSQI